MAAITVGIAGAGLVGRLLAWRLGRLGLRVSVFDPAPGPGPRFGEHGAGQHAAAFTAAGMLSPQAELESATPEIAQWGWRSIALWRDIVQALRARPAFADRGSLMLAHRSDLGAAQRVLARLGSPSPQALDAVALGELEPALQGASHAWLLPGEAQIDTVHTMVALQAEAPGVTWHWQQPVRDLQPGRLLLAGGDTRRFDVAIDARGLGARSALPVRGERGTT